VGLGRFGPPAGIGQGIAELDLELRSLGWWADRQAECEAVQARGAVERKRLRGLGRRRRRILGGAVRIAGPEVVSGQHLGISPAGGEQRRGQPVVAFLEGLRREMSHYRVADAIVVSLDLVPA